MHLCSVVQLLHMLARLVLHAFSIEREMIKVRPVRSNHKT
jgi:hypothetical protein